MSDILKRFHPLIGQWFADRFGAPTDVQVRAWTEVVEGRHVLVTAPTGSGKTLAAFLWAINQLVTGAWTRGVTRVLYISPLKALNNDVRRNLTAPLHELETWFRTAGKPFPSLNVLTRSGDTPGSERQRMLSHPPEILVTTPESLNILLTSASGRHALTGICTVILDEIHAVAGTKRGTHLITGVDRLVPLSGEFQRIALSATVRPLDTISDFVGGFTMRGEHYEKRNICVVHADQAKEFLLEIRYPEETPGQSDEEFWTSLANEFRRIITVHRSTLFFVNSRRTAERVTRLINESAGEELAYAHHGSLSKEIRLAVEERLKRGELKAIVATNSLELGIDIGRLDNVVLVQSPRSISSAIQRIGRSGHGVGEVSRGLLYPSGGMDAVEAAVIARAITERDLEPLHPVEVPLDILAQIILSMTVSAQWDLDHLYAFLRTSYPYRNLSRKHYDIVIGMLEGRYVDTHVPELRPRVTVDRLTNTISAGQGAATRVYLEGGTIPDRGYFDLRIQRTGAKIGELDEEFVWERRVGDTFSLGAHVWEIREITHNAVEVTPSHRRQQIIPFWRAEELDRDFYFSEKIASFLEFCNDSIERESFIIEIAGKYAMGAAAAEKLRAYLRRQKEATGAELPHRHHLLVEHFRNAVAGDEGEQVIVHTLWGNNLNRPFTFALAAAWEDHHGYPLQAFYNNNGIALLIPGGVDPRHLLSLVTPENIEALLAKNLEKTGYFGARFRENAGRALLLSKMSFKRRMPLWLTRLRAKKLFGTVSRYRDFPILIETWRSCLQDDFDLPSLKHLLAEIQDGEIRVGETSTTVASPFAEGLIWQQTNKYIYEDDTPEPGKGPALGQDLIRELTVSSHLRPRLPVELIRIFEAKRQRTASGYVPEPGREVIDWVKERLVIPYEEWLRLVEAVTRDYHLTREEVVEQTSARVVRLAWPGGATSLICAIESLPEVIRGLGIEKDEVTISALVEDERVRQPVSEWIEKVFQRQNGDDQTEDWPSDEDLTSVLVGRWLSYYGPVEVRSAERTPGIGKQRLSEALRTLEEAGQVVIDEFTEGSTTSEICDASNLESLLRILRRSRQPAFEPLEISYLPLFLAQFQGLIERGRSLDDLQKRLEQLFGSPLPVNVWEEDILPARITDYRTAWMDSLMQSSDLAWFGCGDKKASFAFPEDIGLFMEKGKNGTDADASIVSRLIPDQRARYNLSTIASLSGVPAATVADELWKLAWAGEVTNDSFVPVRKGILNRFHYPGEQSRTRRLGLRRRWETERTGGNWYVVQEQPPPVDPIAAEEMNKERVRVLLDRYGILFRELLPRELPLLQWQRVFRTLRIMELSGEVLCGSFFDGIPGLQFISHEAYRMLNRSLLEENVFWLSAIDPASLCGVGLDAIKDQLPSRIPTTHLVYHGRHLVVVSRGLGKEIRIYVSPDYPHLRQYLSFFEVMLSREFNPWKSVKIEYINDVPAFESPYRKSLIDFGFMESYKGLELWRTY